MKIYILEFIKKNLRSYFLQQKVLCIFAFFYGRIQKLKT